VAGNVAERKTT